MGVGVQGEPCRIVAQHGGEGFDVYAVLEGQDGERMSECVEGDFLQSSSLQHPLEHVQDTVGGDWTACGGRKHVLAG